MSEYFRMVFIGTVKIPGPHYHLVMTERTKVAIKIQFFGRQSYYRGAGSIIRCPLG